MLTPTATAAGTASQPAATKQNDLGQKDIFLKLLVAQMQYQNPLKPQDPTQMSSQLAQFNMVEQQTSSNTLLQQLVDAGGTQATSSAGGASYLGKNVTVQQNQINFNGSPSNFSIVADYPAAQAQVTVLDSTGAAVRTINLSNLPAGSSNISWNGITDSGATAAQGNYTLDVQATDTQGSTVTSHIEQSGIVDAVRFSASGTTMIIGGIASTQANITEIRL
ncbi:MAG: flagellar hook capping protein [Zetaproteobacteria bacterium CG12_big_fil_rev_8_21_14_0_65_54_13]|nr:MAG: flagellar hook capping protein [Zetaproteobacteria bacterium CG23_combo_of_CG06-09_8_20_14_all_54_7]PIW51220.1 MAG: flagellar hook capping protein [Zetaproteobacteria bacterium CG12_big_fil_rev_8_21_14_0_65_54_13]PIX53518.1 MAG: flagellar hook capping protein [Zetaproteobacteria bacterium CG_4_10_14_3_um_filter_54_28]PJA28328.1 MAG: flagellar hook capping protein [Zetaproteobacteria bacterium CG_4_9_14_3_um_filter_54_145]